MTHPNKLPFTGILALVDTESDASPSGARGHKVILTRQAALDALPTLIGMGISFSGGNKHYPESKYGVIESAHIVENEIRVAGYLFARDCTQVISKISASAEEWGMSYEITDADVSDMRQAIWQLTRVTFTGAAVIPREKAAYKNTKFVLIDGK